MKAQSRQDSKMCSQRAISWLHMYIKNTTIKNKSTVLHSSNSIAGLAQHNVKLAINYYNRNEK